MRWRDNETGLGRKMEVSQGRGKRETFSHPSGCVGWAVGAKRQEGG